VGADEPVTPNERVVTKASGRVEFPSAAGTGDEGSYKQRDVGGCRNVATEDGEMRLRSVDNQKLVNTMEEPGAVRHQVFDHLQASHGSMC